MVLTRLALLTGCLLGFGIPGAAHATLDDFGAMDGGSDLSDVVFIPETSSTTLDLVFSTTGTDDPFDACADPGCIFGWTATLTTTGTLQIVDYDPSGNPNTASGSGETSCDPTFLPASSCQTTGGDAADGEAGVNIVMFSLTVSGGSPGDELLYSGDFTLSDFSSAPIQDQVIATVIPEPGTLMLFGGALSLLGILRQRHR